jgi:three-Cys-motif partner protein
MSKEMEIVWSITPHTRAKHLILQNYIGAWLAIISQKFNQALFIDGFCGPGEYRGGEFGSPIIAINEAFRALQRAAHVVTPFRLDMYFIDEHRDRIAHLNSKLGSVPNDARIINHEPIEAEFEAVVHSILKAAKGANPWVPTFVFIDPFGVKGCSLRTIHSILSGQSAEVFMLFDVDGVNRLLNNEAMMKEVFGEEHASEAMVIRDAGGPGDKFKGIRDLHQRVITGEECGCRYYLPFRIKATDRQELYDLVFLTNNSLGFLKMKEAMWKADASGAFCFVDSQFSAPELDLGLWKAELWRAIAGEFAGKTMPSNVVEKFVIEKTRFLSKHKKEVLNDHEADIIPSEQRIIVTNRLKKNTYPPGASIQFPG